MLGAAHVFAERGYDQTSVPELAEALGLAAGSLYHYFGGKEQLLRAICDQLMDPLLERAEALLAEPREPATSSCARSCALWVEHVVAHRDHMLVFQQERHVIERGAAWRGVRASRKAFERLAEDALERAGATRATGDPRLALFALLGMVNHTAQWYRPRGRAGRGRDRGRLRRTCCSARDRRESAHRSRHSSVVEPSGLLADTLRALTSQIENISDPRYVRALGHPLRVRILAILEERTASAVELARMLSADIGVVAYHVRKLHQLGLIELERETRVRGAIQRHYRAYERRGSPTEAWRERRRSPSRPLVDAALQQIHDYGAPPTPPAGSTARTRTSPAPRCGSTARAGSGSPRR